MKKLILASLLLFCCQIAFSQTQYLPGYIVNNSGVKQQVEIRDEDWKATPTSIKYRNTPTGKVQSAEIKNLLAFGLNHGRRFERHTVQIDRSTDNLNMLSHVRQSKLEEATLFLELLVSGKAKLYYYESGNLRRFFYAKTDGRVEPLIYKKYYDQYDRITTNNRYQQQLFNHMRCEQISTKEITRLDYKKSDMMNYFIKYNACFESDATKTNNDVPKLENTTNYTYDLENETKEKAYLFLGIKPGFRNSSFEITGAPPIGDVRKPKFDNQTSFTAGIEVEIVLPIHNNKWAMFVEPTFFNNFEGSKTIEGYINEVSYSSIEVIFGGRHYFYLNKKAKLFLEAGLIVDILSSDSELSFDGQRDALTMQSGTSFSLGAGFKYNNRYSIAVRYQTPRNLLQDHTTWNSEYSNIGVVLGYHFSLLK